ncbi:MAG: DNA polymerase III subunit beta [Oscillospiraceae bacterium]|nr:DNA polymerase III subunit beta [Oscillospiraceae bacterium]MCR4761714.1 DNA polymerase III subunit beta [Oscillospiraceae bacterium]
MKITCQKSDLYEVLPNVAKATGVKTPMEALSAIRLRASGQELELTGYDLELGIRTTIPAAVEEEGVLLADSRLFSEIVRRMPEGVLVIETDERLKITMTGGGTSCQLAGMNADEYPELPDIEQQQGTVIPQSLLKNMIEQTIYAVSMDETKPVFTGELIEIADGILNIVALDNYRMALRTEPLPEQESMKFVVPAKALREIQHLLGDDEKNERPCVIRLDQHHAIFEIDRYTVYTRLLAGEFINYRRSIPETAKTEVLLSRRELMDSLDRCGLLISEKNKTAVRFQFEEDRVLISCQNVVGSVDDQISCEITGEKLVIGFNNRYLLDAVRAVQSDRVRLFLTAADRAVKVMEADGDGSVAVIMPVQVRR